MLENLRKLRIETGTTQKQLAEAIGISQQSINKYENHNIEPDVETLIQIAKYFNTSVDYLIGYSSLSQPISDQFEYNLSTNEIQLLNSYRNLSQKQKNCIHTVIESYR